ncbi:MAG TPA: hypothetical protein VGQ68_02330 [Gaiellaceae bacterium]|jgi:hypothetical protein|nr:hypothetical protein [Gaiellaceae bacterium]
MSDRLAKVTGSIAAVASLLGVLAALGVFLGGSFDTEPRETPTISTSTGVGFSPFQQLSHEVASLQAQVKALRRTPRGSHAAADVAAMRVDVNRLNSQLSALETAVLDDPAKALQLPLLRRDLEATQEANRSANESTRDDVDRQYDLMKWVFGTFIVALLGTLVTALLALRKTA